MSERTIKLSRKEAIAQFRAEIVGRLVAQELDHGELRDELRSLSEKRYRPPGSKRSRTYSVPTLERWYYMYRQAGVDGLSPKTRQDAGRGRALDADQRSLLVGIRREHPAASVPLILRTLTAAGTMAKDAVSPQTVRRLYQQEGLPRLPRSQQDGITDGVRQRLRWTAPYVNALWHGDVCHALRIHAEQGKVLPVLVHLLLDDHSRYIVRIEAREHEREIDMLEILANAIREYGTPDLLYLDNGSTYSGAVLPVVCQRLGINLSHHRPYDSPAGGKRERLFRTMREQCTDYITAATTRHDVFVRLLAWRDQYHKTPHSSLMGRTPEQVWRAGVQRYEHQQRRKVSEQQLRDAYVLNETRRIRKDSTLQVDGITYEVELSWLAGKTVTLVRSHLVPDEMRIRFEDKDYPIHRVDAYRNADRRRRPSKKPIVAHPKIDFKPADTALDAMLGRINRDNEDNS